MKKSWFCIGALIASPQVVFAQSSVTLYGLVTAGVTYVNNTGKGPLYETETCAPPGCNRMGPRKAVEDLGGGNAAIFTLGERLQHPERTAGPGRHRIRAAWRSSD